MRSIAACIAAASLICSASAAAQDSASPSVPPSSDERRLTPDQVEKILAEAAAKREKAARPAIEEPDEEDAPAAVPQVHGEVGFGIGTGGYREAYGTAIYGLGNDASAAISLDFVDLGKRRFEHQAPPPFTLR